MSGQQTSNGGGGVDQGALIDALNAEKLREKARPERDAWSRGFEYGLQVAIQQIANAPAEKGSGSEMRAENGASNDERE